MAAPSQRGDTVVLALRQSPDWPALAADHARGLKIAPQRYMPAQDVPFFPGWLPDCVACWNTQFSVDFFACRAELRRIARATLDNVAGARVADRANVLKHLPQGDFRLFFLDDDDWFAPDSARRLACTGDEDVSVFPLLRLDSPVVTFVRDAALSDTVIGVAQTFTFRYQTNNYGLHRRLTTPAMLDMLADHADASATAARIGLMDAYYDTLLSVTNKTPVSASVLMRIVDDANAFRRHVEAFVHALSALDLPPRERWMATPMRQTADLFNRALAAS